MTRVNDLGQPIGDDLGSWKPPDPPSSHEFQGRTVTVVPLDPGRDATPLHRAFEDAPGSMWTYLPFGPFQDAADLRQTLERIVRLPDWQPYTVVVDSDPLGFLSYLRINPPDGVIEIGSIAFSPAVQRTTPATESLYLLINNVFNLGYRRCEWKCDDLNTPSRSAGERLGFRYEGTFRQATHYKGRNRDTAWYAITDEEWPHLDRAFLEWLSPDNFDERGRQVRSLVEVRNTR